MISDRRMINSIAINNILSFGPAFKEFDLKSLNVLIGPNGVGKSNFIEVIGLLHALPNDLSEPITEGGGGREWLWKGSETTPPPLIRVTKRYRNAALSHEIVFYKTAGRMSDRLRIHTERIYSARKSGFEYEFTSTTTNKAVVNRMGIERKIQEITNNQSILSQLKDPGNYPEFTHLADRYNRIVLFREWTLGREAGPRYFQKADLPEDFPLETFRNLAMVLNDLQHKGDSFKEILKRMKLFNGAIAEIITKVHGGNIQIFFREKGLREPISAIRLSDGTLRFLALLTVLCHPEPPPLVCIEEPELGLHPDIIPAVARLLVEASHRTQLIVTTHSEILVDALTDTPEAVVVCEKGKKGTTMNRLEKKELSVWLKKYSLGKLWSSGEIGGTRW